MTDHLKQRTAIRREALKTGPAITTEEADARMAVKTALMQAKDEFGGYSRCNTFIEYFARYLANQGFVIRRKGEG
tara:strand:+ start:1016 stop:1240 length:225 start_codon:yes stop_codon:yes gene_type:complete